MRLILLSFICQLHLSAIRAQVELSFDIRYSLPCNFAGSGSEKNQFTELQNGNVLVYRFEADSVFGIKHFLRIWSIDQSGTMQWDRKFSIGEGDSILLSASLKSTGNQAYLVYAHIDQSRKSNLCMIQLDESGNLLSSRKLFIPNDPQVRNIQSQLRNQELVVSFDLLAADSSRSAVFGKIPLAATANAQWFHTDQLQQSTSLYLAQNNEIRWIATKDSTAVDLSLDQTGVYQALQFPANFFPQSSLVFNGSTYYAGNLLDGVSNLANGVLYKHHPNNGWSKKLAATGPSYHGSTLSGLVVSNGKILVLGYGSVPHPTTFLSSFEENGTLLDTKTFDSFHSFNYNRGDLFKHSSGSLFFSKLAGIWTGTSFASELVRLDSTTFTSCNSGTYNYPYTDISIQTGITSLSFTPVNYPFSAVTLIPLQDPLSVEIICPADLSVNEQEEMSVEAYPNPFAEQLVLHAENVNELQIHCSDFTGRELPVQQEIKSDSEILLTPPSGFSGLLICSIQTAKGLNQTLFLQKLAR